MFDERYAALRAAQTPKADEDAAFDDHLFACFLAVGLTEEAAGVATLTDALGLSGHALARLIADALSARRAAVSVVAERASRSSRTRRRCCASCSRAIAPATTRARNWLVAIVARRSMRDDHLWQDLGLFSRAELGRLLARHFPALHAGNVNNMRWKKYFYRRICDLEGFSLCSAPHCSVCKDFASCFGDEDGLSRLAQLSRELSAA